jgi:hypothetical protein
MGDPITATQSMYVLRGHQPRNIGKRGIGFTREDAGMDRVGHGRVLEAGHQVRAPGGPRRTSGRGVLVDMSTALPDRRAPLSARCARVGGEYHRECADCEG